MGTAHLQPHVRSKALITFLGMPTRTSGEIRGRQIAEALGGTACFVDVHKPDWNAIKQNKVALFVRTWNSHLARELTSKGYKVGYEVGDMPVGDAVFRNAEVEDLRAYAHPECDFFVVNNHVQLGDMAQVMNKDVYVIPHHTVNYKKHTNPLRKAQRVGYVGLPEQLSAKDDIDALCKKMGIEFVSIHPNTREECVEIFKTIDVGVVFAEGNAGIRPRVAELMKRYKPNTKLSNFQSFGIRTVCTPYESYLEFGGNASRFEHDRDGMLWSLEMLIEGSSLSALEREHAITVGERFHIDEVIKLYRKMAQEVTK